MSRLIKVENKSKEEIEEIGRKIGEAFAAESKKIYPARYGTVQ